MSTNTTGRAQPPARTHAQAAELLRRPFAPGAIGFRAMMKMPLNGDPFGGAQVAAYLGAQSVLQRLNAVVPGRWRQEFKPVDPPPGSKRLYMACRLIITLPICEDGPDTEAVDEDVGEMDGASRAGLKALYSDARKRAAVAAGVGAYLYSALEPVVLPIGPKDRQVRVIRRSGKADVLTLSPGTEQWLRHGYQQRMSTEAVRRDLGEILSHGEPERGMGQGEAAEQPDEQSPGQAFWEGELPTEAAEPPAGRGERAEAEPKGGNGVVVVDFHGLGPDPAALPSLIQGDLMTDLTLAGAADAPATAAELAARIPVPRRLPERYDGEPLRHLSPSSYTLWVSCPEAWRRRYIKGEKPPPSGSMFMDSRVDDALSAYHRRILEHGDRLAVDQVLDLYREQWAAELEIERDKQGVNWEEELGEQAALELGRQAIELAMTELIPHLGDPVDVQRRLEFTIAPGLEWTVLCYLDLETLKEVEGGEPAPAVVDFKVKNSLITEDQADSDPQAGLYLAGRWLEDYPASELCFAQIAKPGTRRKQMAASLVSTSRTAGQLRGVLARLALAASQIVACYERYGPDQPWGFADPTSWRCSPRYCSAWARCPGGRGL